MSYTAAYEMYISIDLKKKMSARLQNMWTFYITAGYSAASSEHVHRAVYTAIKIALLQANKIKVRNTVWYSMFKVQERDIQF